jgi:hypothetical protein
VSAAVTRDATADPTAAFFDELAQRGYDPVVGQGQGTVRFDLVDDGRTVRWLVAIDLGRIAVSRKNERADCVIHTRKALFDRIATGEVNAWAAMLRGQIGVEGDPQVLVVFQRLLPGPPASAGEKAVIAQASER